MATLAASAYFLTCCRPIFGSSFCFKLETPRLVNLYHYPNEYLFTNQYLGCDCHDQLDDHSLNPFNICTDGRAWSLDNQQRRQHFLDIICGRIPQCGNETSCKILKPKRSREIGEKIEDLRIVDIIKTTDKTINEEDEKIKIKKENKEPSDVELIDESLQKSEKKEESPSVLLPSSPTLQSPLSKDKQRLSEEEESLITTEKSPSIPLLETLPQTTPSSQVSDNKFSSIDKVHVSKDENVPSEKEKSPIKDEKLPIAGSEEGLSKVEKRSIEDKKSSQEDIVILSDEIIDKLDYNLVNLETTFDKFVKKNRDFIQNLVGCLNFEKQKQKALENSYNKLKQENDILRTKNEYMKMVNTKQLELFRKELDRGISENKVMYKKKIQQMELQLQCDQDKIQYYKRNKKKYLEVVENENMEIALLKKNIETLKGKETKLMKNYVKILQFLGEVRETLNNSYGNGGIPSKSSSNTINGSKINSNLTEVLTTALHKGMKSLNVRDLSILHDAIEDLNERLCHQNEFCGKNPMTNMSISYLSMVYTDQIEDQDNEYLPKEYETSSNLSIYPTRQKPDNSHVQFA